MAVNSFLEEKWRKAFRFFDINKDGYLNREDFEILAAYISEKTNATEEEAALTKEIWVKWLDLLRPDKSIPYLTEEMLVECATEMYKDVENMKNLNRVCYSILFDNLDTDKDDRISFAEFRIYYEGQGVKDVQYIRSVFERLDTNRNGYIERDEFVNACVKYFTCPDNTNGYSFMFDPTSGPK